MNSFKNIAFSFWYFTLSGLVSITMTFFRSRFKYLKSFENKYIHWNKKNDFNHLHIMTIVENCWLSAKTASKEHPFGVDFFGDWKRELDRKILELIKSPLPLSPHPKISQFHTSLIIYQRKASCLAFSWFPLLFQTLKHFFHILLLLFMHTT